jgi:hypothetical protein
LLPIGVDARTHRVFLDQEVPDYYVEKTILETEPIRFCMDIKSKSTSKFFGWVNVKSLVQYQKFATDCEIPVYLIFYDSSSGRVSHADIWASHGEPFQARDKNMTVVMSYLSGLPHLDLTPISPKPVPDLPKSISVKSGIEKFLISP